MITVDREEFQIKLDEINSLVSRKDYKGALEIINTIDWRKVRNVRTLCMVGEVYAANKKYSESREIFLLAYHRSPVGKTILYRLIEVSIKLNDFKEAQEYYEEFIKVAPKDNTRFILQYKIAAAKKAPIETQIRILEKHKEREMTERWSYELAKLYYKAGNYEKCVEACDDLAIWFREGKYVLRALELKSKLTALTPSQQRIYEKSLEQAAEKVAEAPIEQPAEESVEESVKEEPVEETVTQETVEEQQEKAAEEIVEEADLTEEVKSEVKSDEKPQPVIVDEANFQKRITAGIRDIFKKKFKPAEEELYRSEDELKVMHTAGKIKYADVIPEKVVLPDDVPVLEPEKIKEDPVFEPEEVVVEEEPEATPEPELEPAPEPEEVVVEEEPEATPEPEPEPAPEPEEVVVEEEPEVTPEPEPEEVVVEEEPEATPEPEPEPAPEPKEVVVEEVPIEVNIPKLNIPKMNLNETAKVEDLPIEDKISFNLEDTILSAAAKQGIPVPGETPKEEPAEQEDERDLERQEFIKSVEAMSQEKEDEEELIQPEEAEEELSEEEKLMRFIDEQSKDPNAEERDLIPREEVLDDQETKLFKYFSSIPGMKGQLIEALKDTQMAAADKTSQTGNVIIMGNRESGKTTLAELLVKAICRELKIPAAKVARISAQKMNGKDIGKIFSRLSGGFLLIQDINQMDAETAEALNQAMELPTDGLTVIIEDEKIGMRKFIARNPKLIEKFTSTIAIPVFTNDELVNFAKIYTNEVGYKINEMGILALYSLISDNQKEDEPMTVGGVKKLIDDAIGKAESGTRKIQRNLSKTRLDRDGFVILYEKDFK